MRPIHPKTLLTHAHIVIRALRAWWDDDVPRLGASLAYYTLFALAPMLLIAIAIAGSVFGTDTVQSEIVRQISQLVGQSSARAVQGLLESASHDRGGTLASIIGGVTFVITATGAFLELQTALNTIWHVQPKPESASRMFVMRRLRSFGLIVAIGFLLMVSLAVSTALAAAAHWLGRQTPGLPLMWATFNTLISLGVTTVLFALIYRVLPDVQLHWHDVWTGAFATALLFTLGKELLGLYLGQSSTLSSYGAAGSVLVLLLWVYYSSQIVLLGAEFTRAYSERERGTPPPEPFAERAEA